MTNRNEDIIITGHHLDLTDALKSKVIEKASKLFEHEEKIIRLRIELRADQTSHNQKEFSAKGLIEIRGKDLVVTETNEDLYRALDLMVNKLDRMLRRRSRLRVLKRKQPKDLDIPADIPKAQSA